MNESRDAVLAGARAQELLETSNDSVESELDKAEGWLRESALAQRTGYWQMEGAAGAIGALANAWGRLMLLSRVSGSFEGVREELDDAMSDLVDLFSIASARIPTDEDIDRLRAASRRFRDLSATVRGACRLGGA